MGAQSSTPTAAPPAEDANQYEALPEAIDPPPPSSVADTLRGYAASLASWWSIPAPAPATIRAPEDQQTKVKWNNAAYDTLNMPPSDDIFKQKTPEKKK